MENVKVYALLITTCLLLSVFAAALRAQGVTTAGIGGRALDAGGSPVPGVTIELRRQATGVSQVVITNEEGRFLINNLRPGGPYTLEARRLGFAPANQDNIHLRIGQRLNLEIELSAEAVDLPTIIIRGGEDPEVDPFAIGPKTVVTRSNLEALPTFSRDFTDFAQLSPLVAADDLGASVAGANMRFNSIRVDGALNQDLFGLSPTGVAGGQARGRVIPLAAIEELQVLIAPYDVRQSGFTGGSMNAVTRTGGNEFRGSAFAYLRDDALTGAARIGDVDRAPGNLANLLGGFDVSGPLVRDRVHFFVAGEVERQRRPPDGFTIGFDSPVRARMSPDSVRRVSQILNGYGVDAGEAGLYDLENSIGNLFARVDAQLNPSHSLMLRYGLATASDDPPTNRLPGDAYELSSNGTETSSRNETFVAQWLSTLSPNVTNDLLFNLQFLRDSETPNSVFPRVEVDLQGRAGEVGFRRPLRMGGNFLGHDSELDQDILQITNSLGLSLGSHSLTLGAGISHFEFGRESLPGARGAYRFNSISDLAANAPAEYVINVPLSDHAGSTEFGIGEWFAFVQDEIRVGDRLTLRLGLRADESVMLDKPARNEVVESVFGRATEDVTGGGVALSPRFGLNLGLGAATHIRGGLGIFRGRPPFGWLANVYQNTGLNSAFLTCRRRNIGVPDPEFVPAFDPGAPSPTSCGQGTEADLLKPSVTLLDSDFRFPRDFKMSMAIDQTLPSGFVLSLEALFTRAIEQVALTDLNLGPPVAAADRTPENGYTDGYGFESRESFADPGDGSQYVDPPPGNPPDGREPIFFPRRVDDRFGQVMLIGNRAENFSYALSANLRKNFGWMSLDLGYAFNRSADVRSLASLDPAANFGLTAVEGDPNNPQRQASLFDRPHRVVASGSLVLPEKWGGGTITLLYVGQSGRPYSYVYADDINGDSYPEPGTALDLTNDLIFVTDGAFAFPGGGGVPISGVLFEQLVDQEPCLAESRRRILARNTCRTPWSNQVDVRFRQRLDLGSVQLSLMADLLNVLNLVNRDWGQVGTVNPIVKVLGVRDRVEDDPEPNSVLPESEDPLRARYQGPLRFGEAGGVRAAVPYVPQLGASQWQVQLGLALHF